MNAAELSDIAGIELAIYEIRDHKFRERVALLSRDKARAEMHKILIEEYLKTLK